MIKKIIFLFAMAYAQQSFSANTCISILQGPELVSLRTMTRVEGVYAHEKFLGVHDIHRTKVRAQRNSNGQYIKTKVAVHIDHGLFNTPAKVKWISDIAFEMGFNVINHRLPNHNDDTLDSLTAEELAKGAKESREIAEGLGDKVIYIGHSTGGLTSLHAILSNPLKAMGTVFYAPAFEVTDKVRLQSHILGRIPGFGRVLNALDGNGRYESPAAGIAADYFGRQFKDLEGIEGDLEINWGFVIQRLRGLQGKSIWFVKENDAVIKTSVVKLLASELPNVQIVIIPDGIGMTHGNLAADISKMETPEARAWNAKMREILIEYLESHL